MLEKFREKRNEESGFTLVELLVVMLILGILAAIAIPAFFSQRNKGFDSDTKARVRTTQTALETYATDNDGKYTGATLTNLSVIEPTLSTLTATDMTVTPSAAGTGYTIKGTSKSGNTYSVVRSDTGGISNSCTGTGCKW